MLARTCYPTRHAPCQHLSPSDQPQHLVDLDCCGRRKFTSRAGCEVVPADTSGLSRTCLAFGLWPGLMTDGGVEHGRGRGRLTARGRFVGENDGVEGVEFRRN